MDLNYNYQDVSKIHCPQQKCLHFTNVICQFGMLLKSGLMFYRITNGDGEENCLLKFIPHEHWQAVQQITHFSSGLNQ